MYKWTKGAHDPFERYALIFVELKHLIVAMYPALS